MLLITPLKHDRNETVICLRVESLCSANKSMKGQVGTQSEVVCIIQICIILRKSKVMAILTVK